MKNYLLTLLMTTTCLLGVYAQNLQEEQLDSIPQSMEVVKESRCIGVSPTLSQPLFTGNYWEATFALMQLQEDSVSRKVLLQQLPHLGLTLPLFSLEHHEKLMNWLPLLEKEYRYWMEGMGQFPKDKVSFKRLVRMPDGSILNRYWENVEQEGKHYIEGELDSIQNERAMQLSGWHSQGRWTDEQDETERLEISRLVPVDLNCLLYVMEKTLATLYWHQKSYEKAKYLQGLAKKRRRAINVYCWNKVAKIYSDFHIDKQYPVNRFTAATIFPLVAQIANETRATQIAKHLRNHFIGSTGIKTNLKQEGEPLPFEWPPIQYFSVIGLNNYRFYFLSKQIEHNWSQSVVKYQESEMLSPIAQQVLSTFQKKQ
ncbi:trehalase family glycosidase [Algivirga pacifica]|uniref:Uncharacterized protein n=1 Tax=Algivirga pacifica TaxID=1162670 RepID=A0ABP9D7M7_9BACT